MTSKIKKNAKNTGKCGTCKAEVKDGDLGVACDGCKVWFHKDCVDIGDDLYKVLENFESKKGTGLHWYCATCYVGIKKVLVDMLGLMENQKVVVSDIEGLKKRMDEFGIKKDTAQVKQDVELLRRELDEIKKENTVLKREGEETKDMVKQIKKDAVIKKEVDDMSAAVVGVRKENEDLRKLWTEVVESKGQVNEGRGG